MNNSNKKPFTCTSCGVEFTIPLAALQKYPGWVPKFCMKCKSSGSKPAQAPPGQQVIPPPEQEALQLDAPVGGPSADPPPEGLIQPVDQRLGAELEAVLQRFSQGPKSGLFTDGGCSGNPGPGGWGAIRVHQGQIIGRAYGSEELTTNNRMELSALIAAYRMLGPEDKATIWSDSQLCVNTINQWAAGWERKGWRRKGGTIKNLDLVQDLYYLAKSRPRATLCWVKAHNGSRWNEYVDVLATATLR